MTSEQEARAFAKFEQLEEAARQAAAAGNDTRERWRLAKDESAAADRELADEEREVRRLPLRDGARVPPHPDRVKHAADRREKAARLYAEAEEASGRFRNLAQLVEGCRRELAERGLEPDRTLPRRSNARGVIYTEPGKLEQWGMA